MSDDDIWRLNRGGHDARKVFAAYAAAMDHKGQPTVILAQDREGLRPRQGGRRPDGRAPAEEARRGRRCAASATASTSRSPTSRSRSSRWCKPADDAPEMKYLHEQRQALGGYLPRAQDRGAAAGDPGARPRSAPCSKARATARSPPPWPSCASSRSCSRTRTSARTSCPSCPTRRAPSAWKACSARSASTARRASSTRRVDSEQLMSYREDKKGQMLEEGINEAGSTCSWIAAGTAYANHGIHMVPFYIYYSMFGFQRVGDFYLGRGRPAHARLPARRHRRPHHARGRRPAAPGRSQPAACGHRAELRGLRSDVCLRARRDHPRRPASACTRTTRASSITSR